MHTKMYSYHFIFEAPVSPHSYFENLSLLPVRLLPLVFLSRDDPRSSERMFLGLTLFTHIRTSWLPAQDCLGFRRSSLGDLATLADPYRRFALFVCKSKDDVKLNSLVSESPPQLGHEMK